MHVEGLMPASLCLVILISSEQCSQFERFRLQHVQMVNKASSLKTEMIVKHAKGAESTAMHVFKTCNFLL